MSFALCQTIKENGGQVTFFIRFTEVQTCKHFCFNVYIEIVFNIQVYCKGEVTKILVDENGKTSGIQMDDGTQIKAPLVVSAIGYENTRKLLDSFDQKTMDEKILAPPPVGQSEGYLMINIGFNTTGRQANIPCCNTLAMPTKDHDMMDACARLELKNEKIPMISVKRFSKIGFRISEMLLFFLFFYRETHFFFPLFYFW